MHLVLLRCRYRFQVIVAHAAQLAAINAQLFLISLASRDSLPLLPPGRKSRALSIWANKRFKKKEKENKTKQWPHSGHAHRRSAASSLCQCCCLYLLPQVAALATPLRCVFVFVFFFSFSFFWVLSFAISVSFTFSVWQFWVLCVPQIFKVACVV